MNLNTIDEILITYAQAERSKTRHQENTDVTAFVMQKIRHGEVALKPWHKVVLKKLGKTGIFLGCTALAIFSLNLGFFLLDRTGALEFANFGPSGLSAIAMRLPVDFFLLFLVAACVSFVILRKSAFTARHSTLRLAALFSLCLAALAMSFSASGAGKTLLAVSPDGRTVFETLTRAYLARSTYNLDENLTLIGRIMKSSPGELTVETPNNNLVRLVKDQENDLDFNEPFFTQGQIVKAIGHKQGDAFYVSSADTLGARGLNYFNITTAGAMP